MACEQCGQDGQTVELAVGDAQQTRAVCRHCFDVEMRRRLTMNLAAQEYRFQLRTWEELADSAAGDELTAKAEMVLSHLKGVNRQGILGYEAARAFLSEVLPVFPQGISNYLTFMLLELTLQSDLLAITAARLATKFPKEQVLSELDCAFEEWEVEVGIKLAGRMRGLSEEERMDAVDRFVAIARKRVLDSFAREVQRAPEPAQEGANERHTW